MKYDGHDATALAQLIGVPRVVLFADTSSTMDEAHALAADGAPAGTLVLADYQRAGRGRSGAAWLGAPGAAILCTIIERPTDARALDVLSIRAGLEAAAALDAFAPVPVTLKWPNDLLLDGGKLAGILIETRWRSERPEWVAVAIGVNVHAAPREVAGARGLVPGTTRVAVLAALVPALRRAAARRGELSSAECAAWAARDTLAGRRISAPAVGVVRGILPSGALSVETAEALVAVRSGSIVLEGA